MRSLSFARTGTTAAPVVTDVPVPRAAGANVLVEVAASSINGTDIGLRHSSGLMALAMRGSRPGFDLCGRIVACGERVTAFEVGDRVMGLLDHGGGGQADFVAVPQNRLAHVPGTLSHTDAAAIPLAGLTALQALRGRGRLQRGRRQRVLINGAAGGIGSFAIQLCAVLGARVTAVTSRERHDYVTALGAEETVDRNDDGLFGGARTFDLIFDTPGALRFADVRTALGAGGVLVTTHPITRDTVRMIRLPFGGRRGPRVAAVTTSASSEDLGFLARLVEDGRLRVPIDRIFPLSEAARAYDRAEGGDVRGKVVLTL